MRGLTFCDGGATVKDRIIIKMGGRGGGAVAETVAARLPCGCSAEGGGGRAGCCSYRGRTAAF